MEGILFFSENVALIMRFSRNATCEIRGCWLVLLRGVCRRLMGWLLQASSRFWHFYAWRRGYTLLSLFAGVRMRTRVCLSLLCTAGCFEE